MGDDDGTRIASGLLMLGIGLFLLLRTVTHDDGRHNPAGKRMNLVDHVLALG